MRNATCGPELVELSQRAIDDGGNGLRMTNGRYPADRLAGVFAYELSWSTTQLNPELLADFDHVDPMRATGHDQQGCSAIGGEDQRVGDGAHRTSEICRRSARRSDGLVEHAEHDPAAPQLAGCR